MRIHHWFDFETFVTRNDEPVSVKVEATISSDASGDVQIEGVKVKMTDTGVEMVLSDSQMNDVYTEIFERCSDEGIDDPDDDWRNQWE